MISTSLFGSYCWGKILTKQMNYRSHFGVANFFFGTRIHHFSKSFISSCSKSHWIRHFFFLLKIETKKTTPSNFDVVIWMDANNLKNEKKNFFPHYYFWQTLRIFHNDSISMKKVRIIIAANFRKKVQQKKKNSALNLWFYENTKRQSNATQPIMSFYLILFWKMHHRYTQHNVSSIKLIYRW